MKDYTKIVVQKPELTYFTADLHLFHEGIIGHCGRPFKDAAHMSEILIRNWNAVVPPVGEVFVLGDMFWKTDFEKCEKTLARLNGKKWLVAGNHDNFSREEYLAMGFEDARDYLELSVSCQRVVCCHYPLLEWNGFYRGAWHLHGHVHGRGSHFSFRVLDVGVDAHNYFPIPWRDVEKSLTGGAELDEEAMRLRGDVDRHCPYRF